jgi:uncharacterized protein YecE (DUF72 family)
VLRIGPAGWSYSDWDGPVYPSPRPREFDPLRFLTRYFDVIEINSTFYRPPDPHAARSWVRRVSGNPRFVFTAKLWQGFTHGPVEADDDRGDAVAAFRKGLEPLADAGRLSCLLMQFPHSFRPSEESLARIERLAETFAGYPLAVELRRADWAVPRFFDWLSRRKIAVCNIDQPRIGAGGGATAGPGSVATAPQAYVRLHGRNHASWFAADAGRDARYDYLYTSEELEPWIGRIRALAEQAEEVHVITNNHFRGKAVVNALMIHAMLSGEPVDAPQELIEAYPSLSRFAKSPPQGRLF